MPRSSTNEVKSEHLTAEWMYSQCCQKYYGKLSKEHEQILMDTFGDDWYQSWVKHLTGKEVTEK